jgi:transcriptional regulator with XRE-family HTH domain
MEKFGEKLRTLRNRQGLSLRELGNRLDVSHTFVAQMEKGKKIPNVEMILKISRIFDISTDVLIKDELELED